MHPIYWIVDSCAQNVSGFNKLSPVFICPSNMLLAIPDMGKTQVIMKRILSKGYCEQNGK